MAKELYLNLRKSYPFTCWNCGHEQNAAPSLFMQTFQYNAGGGKCLNCEVYLHLHIDEKNERMIATPHTDDINSHFGPLPDACFTEKEKIGVFV